MGSADLRGFLKTASPDSVVVSDQRSPWAYGFSDVATEYLPTPASLSKFGSEAEVASYLRGRLDTLKFKWNANDIHAVGAEAIAFLEFIGREAGNASGGADISMKAQQP